MGLSHEISFILFNSIHEAAQSLPLEVDCFLLVVCLGNVVVTMACKAVSLLKLDSYGFLKL